MTSEIQMNREQENATHFLLGIFVASLLWGLGIGFYHLSTIDDEVSKDDQIDQLHEDLAFLRSDNNQRIASEARNELRDLIYSRSCQGDGGTMVEIVVDGFGSVTECRRPFPDEIDDMLSRKHRYEAFVRECEDSGGTVVGLTEENENGLLVDCEKS